MDREMLISHLEKAEQHVTEGERALDHQRGIVDVLRRDGHDTRRAEALLRSFEQVQNLHIADLARIRSELAQPP